MPLPSHLQNQTSRHNRQIKISCQRVAEKCPDRIEIEEGDAMTWQTVFSCHATKHSLTLSKSMLRIRYAISRQSLMQAAKRHRLQKRTSHAPRRSPLLLATMADFHPATDRLTPDTFQLLLRLSTPSPAISHQVSTSVMVYTMQRLVPRISRASTSQCIANFLFRKGHVEFRRSEIGGLEVES